MAEVASSATCSQEKVECEKPKPIDIDFSVAYTDNEEEIELTKEEFLSLCPTFDVKDADQLPLWRILTVGRLNNNIPILQLLYSCYMRDRIKYLLNKQNGIEYEKWVNKSPTIKRILQSKYNKNIQKHIKKDISSSLSLFFTRRCSRIHLPPLQRIDDDINKYAQIIIETIKFVKQSLNDQPNKVPPFQIDLWIIPENMDDNKLNDDEEEEEDDDDDEDEDDDDDESKDCKQSHVELGDIEKRLKCNKCKYIKSKFTLSTKNSITRAFNREFLVKMNVKYANNDLIYPHKERICIIIDRRNISSSTNNKKNHSEPMYILQPKKYNKLPSGNFMNEWFIEASCSNILPSLGVNNNNEDIINAKKSCHGLMFVLSFQVQELSTLRCWFYNRSQMHRFFPIDLIDLLPMLFKDGKNVLNERIKKEIINLELFDKEFDEIYSPIII